MEVIRARVLGFCMGVRRAVETAEAALANNGNQNGCGIYTLGPLIHNPQVLENFKRRGVEILNEFCLPDDLSGAVVIIRAHGVSPLIETELVRRKAKVIDATCPHVKASQMKAKALSEQGFTIILAGEKEHGEIIGIQGYIKGDCHVAADPEEAEAAAAELAQSNPCAKIALIGQTTINLEEYLAIGEAFKRYFPSIEIISTICGATKERQEALRELNGKAEAFVIAGGAESANTKRLFSIAKSFGKKAWLVENTGCIPAEVFLCPVIGLAAGASTPDKTIDEIEQILRLNSSPSLD